MSAVSIPEPTRPRRRLTKELLVGLLAVAVVVCAFVYFTLYGIVGFGKGGAAPVVVVEKSDDPFRFCTRAEETGGTECWREMGGEVREQVDELEVGDCISVTIRGGKISTITPREC